MKHKAIIFITMVVFVISIFSSGNAYAGNGTRFIGFSARDSGMAGATTASAEDTSCLVKNPAGLVRIGNRIDLEYLNIIPHGVSMNTEGPGLPALGGATFVNAQLRQKSTIGYIPGGNGGISYRLPGTEEYPISVGLGAFTMAGVAVNYPSSRMNSILTGDYDKMADIRSMRIAPGIAVAFNEKLSFGVTGNIAIQGFRTNMATSNVVGGRYLETTGDGNWDFTAGGGFNVGILYQLCDMLGLGASYESHQWMGHHRKYEDCVPYLDEPPVISVGVSIKPIKNLELTYDTRYINWTDIKIARLSPANGGFGWRDQWVFATGAEYTTFKDKLKLRMGYMYGKSPIQPQFVFANALIPLILEHHLAAGFSYYLTKNLSIDLEWQHGFKSVMSDNGAGDVYSQNGNGTKVTAAADVIGVGIGYKF